MKNIEVKVSKKIKERGVFALENIKMGETIEVCPLVVLPITEMKYIDKTKLRNYYFDLNKNKICIVLGYGSLYNHSYNSNATYSLSALKKTMEIKAVKDIKKGEEIFVNYNGEPDNATPLASWFDPNFKDRSK